MQARARQALTYTHRKVLMRRVELLEPEQPSTVLE